MKLINRNPVDFIGRTILYRHQAWLIESVESGVVHLSRPGLGQRGQIQFRQFPDCRLYPEREEIVKQFPMLMRALKHACILTHSEATDAIHGMISTGPTYMGSEAVAHIGGAARAITHAWHRRHNVLRQAKAVIEK